MTAPWYESYFTEEFWAVAEHEYTPERTAAEAGYLAATLTRAAPGRRVLDLGCGTGRHAVALAARGFAVTGADVSAWALKQAAARADEAGVTVAWVRFDALRTAPWPVPPVDAIICVQSFGWGDDAAQLALLAEARRALVPGGVLLLDHSSLLAIVRHHVPEATFEVPGLRADFHRRFHPLVGRSSGRLDVTRGGAAPVELHDDIRLYQPAEVGGLLARAGFAVEAVDPDFTPGAEVTAETRYVQFLARRPRDTAWPPPVEAYAPEPADADRLDLRWTPDEIAWVRAAVDEAVRGVVARPDIADLARDYGVADPFAGHRAAGVLAAHLGTALTPDMVTAGAGVSGLLHALAAWTVPGPLLRLPGGHPDLPRWASGLGCEVLTADGPDGLTGGAGAIARRAPRLVLLDRPSVTGEILAPARVAEIADAARDAGAVVVVDESYATYAGPAASCAPLLAEHRNLIVLRGVSKGYCCGGLRIGFALAAPWLTARLRETAPPLAANATGLAIALRLLAQGDVFAPLRRRIAEIKPEAVGALRTAGLDVTAGAPCLPWLTAPATPDARRALERAAIRAKEITLTPGRSLLRVAVPLSPDRVAAFRAAFAGSGA